MQEKTPGQEQLGGDIPDALPPRPGEPTPGDVGKKGGDSPEGQGPIIDEPGAHPGHMPDVKKGPLPEATI